MSAKCHQQIHGCGVVQNREVRRPVPSHVILKRSQGQSIKLLCIWRSDRRTPAISAIIFLTITSPNDLKSFTSAQSCRATDYIVTMSQQPAWRVCVLGFRSSGVSLRIAGPLMLMPNATASSRACVTSLPELFVPSPDTSMADGPASKGARAMSHSCVDAAADRHVIGV